MSERIPTVKLTFTEWTNIVLLLVTELGEENVKNVLRRALGEERANRLIEEKKGPRLSKEDNRAIIREAYDLIPGETREAKIDWCIAKGRTAFESDERDALESEKRFLEVVRYARARVEEDEAAGGTLDNPPPKPAGAEELTEEFLRNANWLRTDPAGRDAKVTKQLRKVNWVGGTNHNFDMDPINDWPESRVVGGCYGVCCLFIQRGGRWEGGKYDWLPWPQRTRNTNNVGEYLKVLPRSGEVVRFVIISPDGRQATNYVEAVWGGGAALPTPPVAPSDPTPSGEFSYEPEATGTTIRVPFAHWQIHVFSRRKHVTLWGPDKSGKLEHRIPMTGQQLRDASLKAGDDGTLLVFINTHTEMTGEHKNAGWRILNPLAPVRGNDSRLKPGEDR